MSAWQFIKMIFKGLWWAFVIVTPVLAVWLASSLAVFLNGPFWAAVCAGALLFPGIPILWEFWATRRFEAREAKRKANQKEPRERILRFGDRLILRTLFINFIFVAALLGLFPEQSFTALSARGDWPLDHIAEQYEVEPIRESVFTVAESLEWLHNWARENPYDHGDVAPDPDSNEIGKVEVVSVDTGESDQGDGDDGEKIEIDRLDQDPDTATGKADGKAAWPLSNTLHPLVANMPDGTDRDISTVAQYIAQHEEDPFSRVKALHDFVANRVAYDLSTSGVDQDAANVFERRTAVCEGYARLLVALGREAGEEILYIPGVSRDMGGDIAGGGHAWNAARIDGKWYLIDPTWNAGFYENGNFRKEYRTDYLFTPPEIFAVDHLPDNPKWQLLEDPITRGEFVRRPMMRTGFYRQGLVLKKPDRSQISVSDEARIIIENPRRRKVIASLFTPDEQRVARCDILPKKSVETIMCDVKNTGTYQVRIFAGDPSARTFPFVGQIEVVR